MRRILLAAGLAAVTVAALAAPASATYARPCSEGTGVEYGVGDGGIKGQVCL